eukprot:UN34088
MTINYKNIDEHIDEHSHSVHKHEHRMSYTIDDDNDNKTRETDDRDRGYMNEDYLIPVSRPSNETAPVQENEWSNAVPQEPMYISYDPRISTATKEMDDSETEEEDTDYVEETHNKEVKPGTSFEDEEEEESQQHTPGEFQDELNTPLPQTRKLQS